MYINSPGTASQDGMTGFETDAFAIADTMRYIRPEAHTICLGMAYGTASMLLASGARGKRAMLPNAVAMLHQPRSRTQGQASDISLRAKEVLYNRRVLASLIAERAGQELSTVERDMGRTKYLSAEDCLAYGLVDKVLESGAVRAARRTPPARGLCAARAASAPSSVNSHFPPCRGPRYLRTGCQRADVFEQALITPSVGPSARFAPPRSMWRASAATLRRLPAPSLRFQRGAYARLFSGFWHRMTDETTARATLSANLHYTACTNDTATGGVRGVGLLGL